MGGVYAPFITLSTPKNYWNEAKCSSNFMATTALPYWVSILG